MITGLLYLAMGSLTVVASLFRDQAGIVDVFAGASAAVMGIILVKFAERTPLEIPVMCVAISLLLSPFAWINSNDLQAGPLVALNALVTIVWACSFLKRRWASAYGAAFAVTTAAALALGGPQASAVLGAYFGFAAIVTSTLTIRVVNQLESRAFIDPLTRVGNRRRWYSFVPQLARSGDHTLSIVLLDVDRFKEINDRLGHAAGDAALGNLASLMTEIVGDAGEIVRWGGDEFVIALPHMDEIDATAVGDQIRSEAESRFELSVSLGIVARTAGESIDDAISRADGNLYIDKSQRRSMFRSRVGDLPKANLVAIEPASDDPNETSNDGDFGVSA